MHNQILIRKNKDTLITSGYALIVLAVWSLAKLLICYISIPDFSNQFAEILRSVNIISGDLSTALDGGIKAFVTFIFLFQILVGWLSRKEGKRQEIKGSLCAVFAVILAIIQIFIIADDIYLLVSAFNTLFIATSILDIICFILTISITYAISKNKQIVKEVK